MLLTLGDVINEIAKVREAIDGIEVKGNQNAVLLCYAYSHCSEIIDGLNETAKQIQEQQNQNQNGSKDQPEIILTEAGEENGEIDTGSA